MWQPAHPKRRCSPHADRCTIGRRPGIPAATSGSGIGRCLRHAGSMEPQASRAVGSFQPAERELPFQVPGVNATRRVQSSTRSPARSRSGSRPACLPFHATRAPRVVGSTRSSRQPRPESIRSMIFATSPRLPPGWRQGAGSRAKLASTRGPPCQPTVPTGHRPPPENSSRTCPDDIGPVDDTRRPARPGRVRRARAASARISLDLLTRPP